MGGEHGLIDFNGDSAVSLNRPDNNLILRTTSTICDSNGSLLFYTNGFRVFNRNFEIMQNGDSLNIGEYITFGYDLLSIPDAALVIPFPENSSKYYLFHFDNNYNHINTVPWLFPNHLFYCVIDMTLDDGLGGIELANKDQLILTDTITRFGMKAVRHGNGRDWWVLFHEYGTNGYYRFLIDVSGIHGPFKQEIGMRYELYNADIASIMKFSEDGSKFLHLSYDSNCVEFYQFQRCSGELYNYSSFKVDPVMAYSYGASFSPNGRYVYVSINLDEIRQYDLQGSDILGSLVVVGTDDGIGDPFSANYYLHQLTPDGKIYVMSYDGVYSIHVINHPDSAGLACDFVQRGFKLINGTFWAASAPNIPNYSLGPLQGSECDTLTAIDKQPPSVFTFGVYPNPCYNSAQLGITGATGEAEIFLYNTFGQLLYQTTALPTNNFINQQLPVKNLVAGMYLIKVEMGNKWITQKLVKK